MAEINSGTPIRFKNGGLILIDNDTLIGFEGPGVSNLRQGTFERGLEMEGRDILRAVVGDARPTTFTLKGKVRKGATAAVSALNALKTTHTDNVVDTRDVKIQIRQGPGSLQVKELHLDACVFDDITWETGGGEGGLYDTFTLECTHLGPAPDWEFVTLSS